MDNIPEYSEEEQSRARQKKAEASVEELMGPPPEDVVNSVKESTSPDAPQTVTEPDLPEEDSDPQTITAVENIVATESDEVLAAEDEKLEHAFEDKKKKHGWQKLKKSIVGFLRSSNFRKVFIFSFLGLILILASVPTTRYSSLNSFGVRAATTVRILDDSTSLPLKNVKVSVGGSSGVTDKDGIVKLEHLRLGPAILQIEKRAFAKTSKNITVGWGSNPLGDLKIHATGNKYHFTVTDLLSAKPIAKAEAQSGESSAISNNLGEIELIVDKNEESEIQVSLSADTYRKEDLTVSTDSTSVQKVKMVPSRKQVFISRRSGKYDVYKIDIDGKNETKLIAATGYEREDMALAIHPTDDIFALVSTRENVRNKDGFLLSTLSIVDINSGTVTSLGNSERYQILDWMGSRLVYVAITQGASASNPKRQRLLSYNYKDASTKELASANYFNDITNANGTIYYAPSNTGDTVGLYRIYPDGTSKQTVLDKEVWNIFRTDFDKLTLSAAGEWFDYKLGDTKPSKIPSPGSTPHSRFYATSPDGSKNIWVDQRDGKGVLLLYNSQEKTEKVIQTKAGLNVPIRWLNNNFLIYRSNNGQEIADYALNIDGGDAVKIRDVTNTSGVDSWYYY